MSASGMGVGKVRKVGEALGLACAVDDDDVRAGVWILA